MRLEPFAVSVRLVALLYKTGWYAADRPRRVVTHILCDSFHLLRCDAA